MAPPLPPATIGRPPRRNLDASALAEGDRFLGITVPAIRQRAWQFRQLGLTDCERLLQSADNDERLLALLILVEQYQNGDVAVKDKVYQTHLN
ncbi:MAG: DNA alkylation repair protein, partial [bacterium]